MKNSISACIILYNDGPIVENCLESIKNIADEILIVHDGECINDTLEICRKYTNKIFVRPHKGFCEYHQAFLYRKAKFNWILKLDSDEFLSKPLQKKIRGLIENSKVDGYSFIWPYWDGKKYITSFWPRKTNLYRKKKISFLGFTNWGEPEVNGNVLKTNYVLEHRPPRGDPTKWTTFKNRDLKHVLFYQAKDALKDFKEFDRFQYNKKDFPIKLRIRKKHPLLSAPILGILAAGKIISNRNYFKNMKIMIKTAIYSLIRSFYYGYYIYKLQKNPNWKD